MASKAPSPVVSSGVGTPGATAAVSDGAHESPEGGEVHIFGLCRDTKNNTKTLKYQVQRI